MARRAGGHRGGRRKSEPRRPREREKKRQPRHSRPRRDAFSLFSTARTLLITLVLGTVVFAIWFQPFGLRKLAVFWICWFPATILLKLLLVRLPRTLVNAVTIVLWTGCTALVAFEVGLEVIARTRPSPLFARVHTDVERLVRAKRQNPDWVFLGFPFNSQGWYDEEFVEKSPERFRIVSISDSFAWGAAPHFQHFTTVCERLVPRTEVLNLGYSATGPDVYDYVLRHHGLPLSPDLILINLFVGNDLHELIKQDEQPFLQRLFDRENLLSYRVSERFYILMRERARRSRENERELAATDEAEPETPPENPLTIWRGSTVEASRLPEEYPWLEDPELERPPLSWKSFLDIESRRAYSICQTEILGKEWEGEFFARIRRIIATAGDIPILFMIIPDEFQVEDQIWQAIQNTTTTRLERYLAQQKLTAWFEQNGVAYVDLLSHLQAVTPTGDGRRCLYHLRDTHFNRRGNEVTGRVLAQHVRQYVDPAR